MAAWCPSNRFPPPVESVMMESDLPFSNSPTLVNPSLACSSCPVSSMLVYRYSMKLIWTCNIDLCLCFFLPVCVNFRCYCVLASQISLYCCYSLSRHPLHSHCSASRVHSRRLSTRLCILHQTPCEHYMMLGKADLNCFCFYHLCH